MSESWIATLIFASSGLLFILLSIPLILGKIPPNHWYGFRVQKTIENPNIWYAVNRIAGIDFCIAGAIIFTGVILLKLLLPDAAGLALGNMAIQIISISGAIIHAFIVLRRY